MGKHKVPRVLAEGSTVQIIGGEHIHRTGKVVSILGGPHEYREVTVELLGTGKVKIPQHHLKVTRSPEGWKPAMKPSYRKCEAIPVSKEPKANKAPKAKQDKQERKAKERPKNKRNVKGNRRKAQSTLVIPDPPSRHAGRRSKD